MNKISTIKDVFALNENLLQDYSKAKSESEILEIGREYGLSNARLCDVDQFY